MANQGSAALKNVSVGEVLETASEDTDAVAGVFSCANTLLSSLITFVVVGVYLVSQSWVLGSIVLISGPALALGIPRLTSLLETRLESHRTLASEVATLAADAASGSRTLKGIGAEQAFLDKFTSTSHEMFATGIRVAGTRALIEGAKVLIPSVVLFVLLIVGVSEVQRGNASPSQLVVFYGLGLYLVSPVAAFITSSQQFAPIAIGLQHINGVLRTGFGAESAGTAKITTGPKSLSDTKTKFEARAGSFTAVVSRSVDQLRDFAGHLCGVDVPEGSTARLGEQRITDLRRDDLRRVILLAEGAAYISSGDVRSVLRAGSLSQIEDDQFDRALTIASAVDILSSLGSGLDSLILDEGKNLSGGQRQRLSLARAVLRDPESLVLYEPTTAVDVMTEARIARMLALERRGKTTVVFSNSHAFLDVANEVIFFDHGSVAGSGPHEELLENSPAYRSLFLEKVTP